MRIAGFEWDDDNESHAQKHGASVDEIEEVLRNEAGVTTYKLHRRANRRFAYGRTHAGRWLMVLFDFDTATRIARPFGSRDMTTGERTKYER